MNKVIFAIFFSFLPWVLGLPATAKAQSGSLRKTSLCPKGPVVIDINTQKELRIQKNQEINDYEDFEKEAKNLLRYSFQNCILEPNQIQIRLKTNKRLGECSQEVHGPEGLPISVTGFPKFEQFLSKYANPVLERGESCLKPWFNYQPVKKINKPYNLDKNYNSVEDFIHSAERPSKPSPIPFRKPEAKSQSQDVRLGTIKTSNQSLTEGSSCNDCNDEVAGSSDVIQNLIRQVKEIDKNIQAPVRCEPQGYKQGMSEERVDEFVRQGRMDELIQRYSEHSQGAMARAFLAVVKPGKEAKATNLLAKYKNFQNIPSQELKGLFHTGSLGKCYSFIKAALSGDYSIIGKRGLRFNGSLLKNQCSISNHTKGDLAQNHGGWLHDYKDISYSSLAAGNAGSELEKRGFINILDEKYGVAKRYLRKDKTGRIDEKSLPEGAVIIYHCNDRTKDIKHNYNNFTNFYKGGSAAGIGGKNCGYGDIAFKAGNGFLRDFYSETAVSDSGRRVVIGAYIKPTEE